MIRSSIAFARLEKAKRRYYAWVFNENSKYYSLRYAPYFFRKCLKTGTVNTGLESIYYLATFGISGLIAIS